MMVRMTEYLDIDLRSGVARQRNSYLLFLASKRVVSSTARPKEIIRRVPRRRVQLSVAGYRTFVSSTAGLWGR
jgi:hypothetical protein